MTKTELMKQIQSLLPEFYRANHYRFAKYRNSDLTLDDFIYWLARQSDGELLELKKQSAAE